MLNTESSTTLVVVVDRYKTTQAAGSVRWRQRSAFTFRAYASAVSTRMVVLMEHALSATGPLTLSTAPSDKEVNAQLYSVLAMLVKDEAMQKGRTCVAGHGSEIWRLP